MSDGPLYKQRVGLRGQRSLRAAAAAAGLLLVTTESLEHRRLMTTFYVDTNNAAASDSNAGTSIDQPLKTIGQALALTENDNLVSQSDTILIRGGVYREEPYVYLSASGASATDRTVISAYSNSSTGQFEPVYIDAGTPVTGTWKQRGSSDIWYLNNFTTETAGVWVDWSPSNDGASLQQIGGYNGETSATRVIVGSGIGDMYPGTYFGDQTKSRLYVWLPDGSNPNSHTIEYANNSHAIYQPGTPIVGGYAYASHVDFVGLHLRHVNEYNTSGQDAGCGIYTENDDRLINCDVQFNTRDGVHLDDQSQLINCISDNNGGNGVAAKGTGFQITGGQYNANFYRQYNDGSNGGIKVITNTPNPYGNIQNVEAAFNYGQGIWFDTCFENSVVSQITGNYVHDNQSAGIDLEASRNYLVANNVVTGNAAGGIVLNAVENANIFNNTLVGNYGIATIELNGGTRSEAPFDSGTVGMLNNQIEDNIIANNFTVYDLDVPTSVNNTEVNNNTSDYNLFYRRGGSLHFTTGGSYVGWAQTPSAFSDWQSDSGQDAHSLVADPMFVSGGAGALAYQIGSNSPAIAAGAVLAPAVTADYSGNARSQSFGYDLGAFAFNGEGSGTAGPIVVDNDPTIWVDDQLPANAAMTPPDQTGNTAENRFWQWESSNTYSGAAALDSTVIAGAHRQYFTGANARTVATGDNLFAYIWIDPANPPSQVMFEWQDSSGSWAHQAYWGLSSQIGAGIDGSTTAQQIGALPSAGQWVKLSVPASVVGLAGQQITGFSFDLYNGRALLDDIGNGPASSKTASLVGSVFQDNNGNGLLDTGEMGMVGQTVFVDLNNDGTLDTGDPTAVTNATGQYSFSNLSSGTYSVAQIVPTGFVSSTGGGTEYSVSISTGAPATQNFGDFPTQFTSIANGNNIIVALSSDQSTINIWQGVPESAVPSYSIAQSQLNQLSFSAGKYYSSLTVDFTNGAPSWSGPISFDGGSAKGSLFVIGAAYSNFFSVGHADISVNSFDVNFSNIGSLTAYGGAGYDVFSVNANPAPLQFIGQGGSDSINVYEGSYTFTTDPVPASQSMQLYVAPNASVIFAANPGTTGIYDYHILSLDLDAGATAIMQSSTGSANRSLLILNYLSLDQFYSPFGQLDEGNGDMIIYGGDPNAATNALASGYANGAWNSANGIDSSAAAGDVTHLTAIGLGISDGGQFDGQTVSSGDLLFKYTYVGDTNLDGVVDGSDYARVDFGILAAATGWFNGDLNYDGVVDGSDYTLLDNAYNTQGASIQADIARPNSQTEMLITPVLPPPSTSPLWQLNNSSAGHMVAMLRSAEYLWMDPAVLQSRIIPACR